MYETIELLAPAAVIILVHLFVGRVRVLDPKPGSPWLSAAAGTAIAYVFVYLLPKLAVIQTGFSATASDPLYTYLRHHVYLITLAGFVFFYWTHWTNVLSETESASGTASSWSTALALKVAGLAAYTMQMGYLIADSQRPGPIAVVCATAVLVFHFLGLDNGFRHHHRALYDGTVRWILAAATFAGWLIGALTTVHPVTVGLWSAFIGGGIIVMALREELPSERQMRFVPFLAGVAGTSVLLLLLEQMVKG